MKLKLLLSCVGMVLIFASLALGVVTVCLAGSGLAGAFYEVTFIACVVGCACFAAGAP